MEWVQELSSFPHSAQQGTALCVRIIGKYGKAEGRDGHCHSYISDSMHHSLKIPKSWHISKSIPIIFDSTPKITKHRECNYLGLLGQ